MSGRWVFDYEVSGAEDEQLGSFRVPASVVARYEGHHGEPEITVEFTVRDGTVHVGAVRFEAGEDREVRTVDLAGLDLPGLAEEAVAAAMTEVSEPDEHGAVRIRMRSSFDPARRAAVRQGRKPARRRAVTDDRLREVAEVYRAAVQGGKPPTKAVQDHLGQSHRTAVNWIRRARERGFLGPSLGPGKAGEGKP